MTHASQGVLAANRCVARQDAVALEALLPGAARSLEPRHGARDANIILDAHAGVVAGANVLVDIGEGVELRHRAVQDVWVGRVDEERIGLQTQQCTVVRWLQQIIHEDKSGCLCIISKAQVLM